MNAVAAAGRPLLTDGDAHPGIVSGDRRGGASGAEAHDKDVDLRCWQAHGSIPFGVCIGTGFPRVIYDRLLSDQNAAAVDVEDLTGDEPGAV